MMYNRILKINIVFLIVLVLTIIASTIAIYKGNSRFFGIIAIAILALAIVIWRIVTIGSEEERYPGPDSLKKVFDSSDFLRKVPPKK
jgi:hypothetical protein